MAHDVHFGDDHHGHHIIPIRTLLMVFGALVFLTIVTVATAKGLDLGPLNVPLAIVIAVAKAALVVMFFMALKYDNRVNLLTFTVGTIFVLVFLIFTWFDTGFRGDLGNVDPRTIDDIEREEEALRAREPAPEQLRVAPGDFIDDAGAGEEAGTEQ